MTEEKFNPAWEGYPVEQKQKWKENYERRQEADIANSVPLEEAKAEAKKLFDEGWMQRSRKYRRIVDTGVKPGADPLGLLAAINPSSVRSILFRAVQYAQQAAREALWFETQQTRELDYLTFEEFRKLSQEAMQDAAPLRTQELLAAKEESLG